MTEATPLASEQITQPDWFDDILFLRSEIDALFARTKGHSLRAEEWNDRGHAILDRIAALSGSPAPVGWRLVPIEPTEEQLKAGCAIPGVSLETGKRMWSAMLAASPAPSGQGVSGEVAVLLDELATYLPSIRVFLTSRKQPHEAGVQWHDELVAKINAAREARHV